MKLSKSKGIGLSKNYDTERDDLILRKNVNFPFYWESYWIPFLFGIQVHVLYSLLVLRGYFNNSNLFLTANLLISLTTQITLLNKLLIYKLQ